MNDIQVEYTNFFEIITRKFQQVIYVHSPSSKFWSIEPQHLNRFEPLVEYAIEEAYRTGCAVLDGTNLYDNLLPFRRVNKGRIDP